MNFIENKSLLKKLLPKIKKIGIKNFINGELTPAKSRKTFDNHSPINDDFIYKVASSNAKDIDVAATAAHKAFKTWRKMPHRERKKILYNIAAEIEKNANVIAVLESYDTGQLIRFMANAAIRGAESFRLFADKITEATQWKIYSRYQSY